MSFLAKIFGGKKGESKQDSPSSENAIQKLREVEEMLLKKQEYLEKKVEEEIEIIKKNGTANKKVSLPALKRKKRLDAQLEQIQGTLMTIDTQRVSLENATTNAEVLKVMKYASQSLKQAQNNMDMDKVEDIIDEMKEQQQIADEIQQMISGPLGFGQDVDEDELLAELEDLNQQELDEQLLSTDKVTGLPEVPGEEPEIVKAQKSKSKAKEEEEDMKELAAWASN